jgi:hypothetical protein
MFSFSSRSEDIFAINPLEYPNHFVLVLAIRSDVRHVARASGFLLLNLFFKLTPDRHIEIVIRRALVEKTRAVDTIFDSPLLLSGLTV